MSKKNEWIPIASVEQKKNEHFYFQGKIQFDISDKYLF